MHQLDAEPAPAELHAAVGALLDSQPASPRRPRRSWRPVAAGAVAVAAVVALVAVLVSGNGSSTPTVKQAALLALRQPTEPSPAESPTGGAVLERDPGWHPLPVLAARARVDHQRSPFGQLRGVFGEHRLLHRQEPVRRHRPGRVHDPLRDRPAAAPATAVERKGTRYYVLSDNGATVVTWRRLGHTCILAARGLGQGTLLHLAAWA